MKASQTSIRRRFSAAYSLIEVLVAAALLAVGVSAAARLSLIMVTQEDINQRISVSVAHQEIAMRLYQLGLEPSEVTALLPDEPDVASLTFTTGTTVISGAPISAVEYAESTMVTHSTPSGARVDGQWNGGGDAAAAETRTNVVRGHRYANRYR